MTLLRFLLILLALVLLVESGVILYLAFGALP